MEGFAIEATDGRFGHITDFYIDEEAWVIRYLVVETGQWLSNPKVLVSSLSMDDVNWDLNKVPVRLTREQILESPRINTKTTSMLRERDLEFPTGDDDLDCTMNTRSKDAASEYVAARVTQMPMPQMAARSKDDDRRLRSCNAFIGYRVQAADGEIGHVQGILVDEKCWAIRYLIVNTSDWWLGHQVLVATDWVTEASWLERKIMIGSTRQASKEALIHQHYGRNCSWQYETLAPIASRLRPSNARAKH
jgi:hypothetical protein